MLHELEQSGYTPVAERVETLDSLKDALDGEAWDIILSDYRMPAFNALVALRMTRERGIDVPFIVISGSIGQELAVAIMKAGADDCVLKEDLRLLPQAVERALRDVQSQRERKRAEQALRESEERFALAVRGSRDGIWDRNFLTGEVYYSPRVMEMLGFEEGEIGKDGASFDTQIHQEDRNLLALAIRDHIEQRVPYDVEFRVHRKDGSCCWLHARGQARWDDTGQPIRMAGSITDLTARKQAEAELKEQLELNRQQQEAIRTLSTPIIEVWDGVLTIPVLGVLDTKRATEMMDSVLTAVTRTGSQRVIIDLTGVKSIDMETANHVIKLVDAVNLVGAQGIVVGIQPNVACAMVSLGVDLSLIRTLANLREALQQCIR